LNAARGLSETITWLIKSFVNNFLTAAQPPLVKYYASGDRENFNRLIFNTSQYSLFLFSVIAIPVFLEIDFVLNIWLDAVPEYTSLFIRAVLIISIISFANNMIDQGIVAIGRVKELNMFVCPIYLTTLPVSYGLYRMGFPPLSAYIAQGTNIFICFLFCLFLLHKYASFQSVHYFFKVFALNLLFVFLSFLCSFFIQSLLSPSWLRLFVVTGSSIVSTGAILWYFALPKEVKRTITGKIFR
jgi:hypothetical protein